MTQLPQSTIWPPLLDFVKSDWGNLASVGGLILTCFALWFARSARTAARDARAEVRLRNLTDEVRNIDGNVQRLREHAQQQQWPTVQLLAEDCYVGCARLIDRLDGRLKEGGMNRLLNTRTALRSIARLARSGAPDDSLGQILSAQLKVREHLQCLIGECERLEEADKP